MANRRDIVEDTGIYKTLGWNKELTVNEHVRLAKKSLGDFQKLDIEPYLREAENNAWTIIEDYSPDYIFHKPKEIAEAEHEFTELKSGGRKLAKINKAVAAKLNVDIDVARVLTRSESHGTPPDGYRLHLLPARSSPPSAHPQGGYWYAKEPVLPILDDAMGVLGLTGTVRNLIQRGDAKYAGVSAFLLGTLAERMVVRTMESHVPRGRKVLDGARAGHKATHGTSENRQKAIAEAKARFKKMKSDDCNLMVKYKRIAVAMGLSEKTIRRYLKTPS